MKLKGHHKYLQELLDTETDRINRLHEIVEEAVKEEAFLTESLNQGNEEAHTKGERIASGVARFIGSWSFIAVFCVVFFLWICLNTYTFFFSAIDNFPFDGLKLALAWIGAVQAPLIMMSQNRQSRIDRKRTENEYMINLKAEIEVRNLHKKMDLLMKDQMKNMLEVQKIQLDLIEKLYIKIDKISLKQGSVPDNIIKVRE